MNKIKSKKAAIELSIGTVVIIVLAMSMLILGIILIRNIFSTATSSITEIDQGVKDEINRLFAENDEKTLIRFPNSGLIEIERGSSNSGFAIAFHNTDNRNPFDFEYEALLKDGDCPRGTAGGAVKMAAPGQKPTRFTIQPEQILVNSLPITFTVSESAPLCKLEVEITAKTNTNTAEKAFMFVSIIPE